MESRNPVEVIQVMLYCDGCGARMHATGEVLMTYPPKYPHKCPDCGFMEKYENRYPYIEYLNEEDDNG